jgi:thiol:disulfide interchange protein DsbC
MNIEEENLESMNMLLKASLFVIFCTFNVALTSAMASSSVEQDIKDLRLVLSSKLPNSADAKITATPVKGIYQFLSGAKIMYMTKDARYIFDGDLIDFAERRNLSEEVRGAGRKNSLDALGEKNMLVYTPKDKSKHTITVFTDIYCPYCRRLHDEMNQYMAAGVKVRYIFLPFKGKKSFDDSVSVWCADNPQKALDKAKAGESIEAKTCAHPIEKHRELASLLGIRGTPAIMFEDGTMNPGYVPAGKIIQQLNSL